MPEIAVVPLDDDASRGWALNVTISIWASEAGCCPTCGLSWTLESVKARDPLVGSVDPRVLVCPGECWERFRALAPPAGEEAGR